MKTGRSKRQLEGLTQTDVRDEVAPHGFVKASVLLEQRIQRNRLAAELAKEEERQAKRMLWEDVQRAEILVEQDDDRVTEQDRRLYAHFIE